MHCSLRTHARSCARFCSASRFQELSSCTSSSDSQVCTKLSARLHGLLKIAQMALPFMVVNCVAEMNHQRCIQTFRSHITLQSIMRPQRFVNVSFHTLYFHSRVQIGTKHTERLTVSCFFWVNMRARFGDYIIAFDRFNRISTHVPLNVYSCSLIARA